MHLLEAIKLLVFRGKKCHRYKLFVQHKQTHLNHDCAIDNSHGPIATLTPSVAQFSESRICQRTLDHLYNRARWIGPSEQKMPKIKSGHMYSYVKLNFRVGLFSWIFWFEAIFCCFFGILYLPYFTRGNCQNKPENQQNWNMAKIAPKSHRFMK